MTTTRQACEALDANDALASLRKEFDLPAGVIYLDGNSLGALPRATAERLRQVVDGEWGRGLIRSWNSAGWIDLSRRVGDKIATLVGARPNELIACDSTSVNLYKALHAALVLSRQGRPERCLVVSERSNFPTDLYIADSVARQHGCQLELMDADDLPAQLDERAAVLLLTHVNYRTGRMHDMAGVTNAAHAAGALTLWDLSHSTGAVALDLHAAGADFAVGCGYKFLNGGPGAPAFIWAHPRHTAQMDREQLRQPLSGWFGHAAPFDFGPDYVPAAGIGRFACGTPPVLSLAALECGVDVLLRARRHGGMATLRAKSIALTTLFIERVEARCAGMGLTLMTPRDASQRGSQVSFAHAHGHAVMQALIERGVIGDFRAGDPGATRAEEACDLLRFGFTLYTRHVDVWDAAEHLAEVLGTNEWRAGRFMRRAAVT